MYKQNKLIFVVLLTLIFSFGFADEIPHTISYQGKLLENNVAVDGSVNLMFRVLNSQSAVLWEEIHTGVNVDNGLYSVSLGSVNRGPIPLSVFDDDSNLYLQIIVNGIPLTPNTELQSVPYAYKAEKAYNSEKLNGELPDYYLDWTNISNIPADIADGDDTGSGEEVDPTVPENIKDGIDWIELTSRPTGLDDGDNVGLNSIDGVANENGNVDLIAGDNITITPDDANNTIEISSSGGGSHNAGYDFLLSSQNYVKIINTNLGHRPKIVEFCLSASYNNYSQARWIDENQDGSGVLSCLYTDENTITRLLLLPDTDKIGRMQTGSSDSRDLKIETSINTITITVGQVFGAPADFNIVPFTWYAE